LKESDMVDKVGQKENTKWERKWLAEAVYKSSFSIVKLHVHATCFHLLKFSMFSRIIKIASMT